MNNTYQILINWDKGQAFSERMASKILDIENFTEIDPQNPIGGRDGKKDIICYKNGNKYVVGCYFPNGQKTFKEIEDKFNDDIKGVKYNKASGFIFITNQKITPSERVELSTGKSFDVNIFHGERVCSILDSPKGYGIRLEYLGIELSKEEQISFLNAHIDLKENFEEIKRGLAKINKVTTKLVGEVYQRDIGYRPLSTIPIAGVKFSSRLAMEDLLSIHKIIMNETQGMGSSQNLGFRKVEVWIGGPGGKKESADYVPVPPNDVIPKIYELLKWWREEYMKVCYSNDSEKISAIALFHEKFLTIHPFLDGNGRVARVVASIQYKDLLDKDVMFDQIERADYYNALQNARDGNIDELKDIFMALIKD